MTSRNVARAAARGFFAAGLLAAPMSASAQTPAPAPAGVPAPAANGAPPRYQKLATERAEARIKELHGKLHITAAQQPQWDAFTTVMRENAQHAEATAAERGDPKTLTALDAMRGYTNMAAAHAADMQKMLPAFETLYNSMSPEQQKQADTVFREQEGRRRR